MYLFINERLFKGSIRDLKVKRIVLFINERFLEVYKGI